MPRREISETEFESQVLKASALGYAAQINSFAERIASLYAEENRLSAKAASLKPWESLSVPLNYTGGKRFFVMFGTCPSVSDVDEIKQNLEQAAPESELKLIFSDKEQHYFCFICLRDIESAAIDVLKKYGFAKVVFKDVSGTSATALNEISLRLDEIAKDRSVLEQTIKGYASYRPLLQQVLDFISLETQRDEMLSRLGSTKTTILLEGWVPKETEEKVLAVLEKNDCAYVFPIRWMMKTSVSLKNSRAAAPFGTITELYGLPGYSTVVDPTPFVAVSFVVFFGMMLSDGAYV